MSWRISGPHGKPFHFTVFLASAVLAQLGMIWSHLDSGFANKQPELFLREVSFKFHRPVHRTSGVAIGLTLLQKRRVPGGVYYAAATDVEHGSFKGRMSFVLPVPA